ncbi:MAG: 4-alpha-glucanotransferase [Clostridia bacterium]|nr:4-alpha-glucanotransferase [Clostridia bacterium]
MERKSGVLMHITSLFGDYSAGSFGDEAKYFIDFLVDSGFSYWQVLPFCMADEYNSPYKSFSAFSGNPFFIDLPTLYKKGLITKSELEASRQKEPYACEFDRLRRERFALLTKAALRVKDRGEVEAFIDGNSYLEAFCRFMALKEANGGEDVPWDKWTVEEYDADTLFAWKFMQYEFFTQWAEIKKYANDRGIGLIGDIPIYVAQDSSDVWSRPDMFKLDRNGQPTAVAGCSPDYFSEDGQMWGNPLYNWAEMKKDGYAWWCDRMRHMASMFDAVRIDHFRGFESYWSIPAGAETAKAGKWIKGPGLPFVKAIKKAVGDTLIIAEDLGDITPEVYKMVKDSGLPGMRVFQFGFLGDDNSPHMPHNYPNNCVAYTGTHDNNTLLGYLWELDDDTRKTMLDYVGHTGDWGLGWKSVIRTVLASHAGLVVMPIQDLLGYGRDTRLNVPGKADGNWSYRITKAQLDSIDREYYKKLNRMYARAK